ncbi:peroxiredoxin family protein [Agarivorans sp. Alg241-V36]|uniref:peroxiredoxin family protein n=1 Tax=Agarivorans sp. Alg241-V36 TaxID=2305992 RepID=UPI0013D8B4DF|nr:peroxiredoxin family protein [Agarivorans sp. Alg241-V36]
MSLDFYLSLSALLITVIGASHYFAKVKQRQTPKRPVMFVSALMIASLLSIAALYITFTTFTIWSLAVVLMSSMPLIMTAVFVVTFKESKPPLGNIQVKVGDKLAPFVTTRTDGSIFNSELLNGQRVLLKFFRGSWCPYCSTELKMFEEMKPLFDSYQVKVVALSNDDHVSASKHQQRDHLTHTLLSDPQLKVIRQFGVEHHKALGGDSTSSKTIFGLPFPMVMKYKPMAIPTTLLIDENGIVQWIDQSEDVRFRASEDKLEAALEKVFYTVT